MLILESLTAHILDTETLVQNYSLQVFVKYFTEYLQCKVFALVTTNWFMFFVKKPAVASTIFCFSDCVRLPQNEKYNNQLLNWGKYIFIPKKKNPLIDFSQSLQNQNQFL